MHRRRSLLIAGIVTGALVLTSATVYVAAATTTPRAPLVHGAGAASAIDGQYIVLLPEDADRVPDQARALIDEYGGTLGDIWEHAVKGFSATLTEEQALRLSTDASVRRVEQDQLRKQATPLIPDGPTSAFTDSGVSWGLDRIDQHNLPLDDHYSYDDTRGQGVRVYIVGSGIKASHPEFTGRVEAGPDFVGDGRGSTTDCSGGGTMVGGVIGGTEFGVAKKATLVSVRVYDCLGLSPDSRSLQGLDWVAAHAHAPAVVVYPVAPFCLDLNTGEDVPCDPMGADASMDAQEAIFDAGFTIVGAAGDIGQDTCENSSGAAPHTIYVGGTLRDDGLATHSNFGPCVTMYAPYEATTADPKSNSFVTVESTAYSMAYVAGAAALFAGLPEFAGASPTQIRNELITNRSTNGLIRGLTADSANRLLYTGPPGYFTVGDSLSAAPTGNGGLELAGVTPGGQLIHREQANPGEPWTPPTTSMTRGWQSVGAERNADGRLTLAGLTTSGQLWTRHEGIANSNGFGTWQRAPAIPTSAPIARVAMAHNNDNRLRLLVTTTAGDVYTTAQTTPGSQRFIGWNLLPSPTKLYALTATRNADGRIETVGLDGSGRAWRAAQTSATADGFSAFTQIPGFTMVTVAMARNPLGVLELIEVDTGGGVNRQTQGSTGTWSDPVRLNNRTMARVTAETNRDNRIQLIGVDRLGHLWQCLQNANGTYPDWTTLDGTLRP